MTRQARTLYHARITYYQHNPYSKIIDESHSYDLTDAVYAMTQMTRRFPRDLGYTCDFDHMKLIYIVTKFDAVFAMMQVVSSDDGIDL